MFTKADAKRNKTANQLIEQMYISYSEIEFEVMLKTQIQDQKESWYQRKVAKFRRKKNKPRR